MDGEQENKLFTALGAIKKKHKPGLSSSVVCERSRVRNRNGLDILDNTNTRSVAASSSSNAQRERNPERRNLDKLKNFTTNANKHLQGAQNTVANTTSVAASSSSSNAQCERNPERRNLDKLNNFTTNANKHLQGAKNTVARHTNQPSRQQNSFNHSLGKGEGLISILPQKRTFQDTEKPKSRNDYSKMQSSSKQSNSGFKNECGMVAIGPEIGQQNNALKDKPYNNKIHSQKENRKTNFLGYKRIEALLEDEPSNIVSYLSQSQNGFDDFLKRKKSPDLMLLTMKLVAKICSCNFMQNKASLLYRICNHDFLDQLCSFFSHLPAEDDRVRKSKIHDFFNDVIEFFSSVVNLCPTRAHEMLGNMFIIANVAINGIALYQKMDLSTQKHKLETLETQLKHIVEDLKEKQNLQECNKEFDVRQPPNDFREISICPTKDDLFDQPFLRENIIQGRYLDIDHYLDVQFRLLREDFVGPLREGILRFKDFDHECKGKSKRIENIKVYPSVSFVQTLVSGDRVNYVVNFDPTGRFKQINWSFSKRFMFGSLLCFTNDNFNSLFFGTVAQRDKDKLEAGHVIVQLEGPADNIFSCQFIMVESETYFESYYHVLKALQKMTSNSFPMMKYIIEGDINPITPAYLLNAENLEYVIEKFKVPLLIESHWPTHNQLKLDESQYRAFKSALTNEFVVIQGPPGTGKTYLGLKIAKTLLINSNVWNSDHRPLVVIAYTNHALDQFLVGILKYSRELIRIGGQSKSTDLEKYNLKEVRKSKKLYNSYSFSLYKELQYEMIDAIRNIKSLQVNIDYLMAKTGVLPMSVLQYCGIRDEQLRTSFSSEDPHGNWKIDDVLFINWLQDEFEVQDNEMEMDNYVLTDEKLEEKPLVEEDDEQDIDDRFLNSIDEDLDLNFQFVSSDSCILKISTMEKEMKDAYDEYMLTDPGDVMEKIARERNFNELRQICRFWKEKLKNSQIPSEERVKRLVCTRNLWDLSIDDRWALYWHGWSKLHASFLNKMTRLESHYQDIYRRHQEARHMADLDILRMADVVGLTTSGAARLQSQLVELKPKVVIVEEAAEVLESHIVASLTKDCEHLILIGDHQQLRPSTSVYKLARQYKLDISLFERMICLGMECNTLEVQHRMRPEIARLICPTIYPRLLNHQSVRKYEHIKGVDKSLYFIDHNEPEEHDPERESRKNTFEADFLISLCRYLLLQGYEGSEITILTTYSGQMLYLRQKWKQFGLNKDVRISVVDNFQGEENKIILLSLVRSNAEKIIGFLKIENRVCVALSRAKEGFYMIGNMENLTSSSKIWPKIKETLSKQHAFGQYLTLRCQVHSQLTQVSCSADFSKVPEGGCLLPCNTILNCGHPCISICHAQIERHPSCFLQCERIPPLCPEGHTCTKKCFEECGNCLTKVNKLLLCGHKCVLECHVDISSYKCKEIEEVTLPACSHDGTKLCYMHLEDVKCKYKCDTRLDCGHSCVKFCHVNEDPYHEKYTCRKPCAKKNEDCKRNHICTKLCYEECGKCLIEVDTTLPDCGHVHKLKCSQDLSEINCFRRCKRIMQCGHPCRLDCCAPCGNCKVKVMKPIPVCGHKVMLPCSVQPEQKMCKMSCERTLPCSHKCKNACRMPCTNKCMELVPSKVRPACGHGIEIPCYMLQKDLEMHSVELLAHCQVPCGRKLQCDHICQGTCGSCWQGRLHILCKEKCGRQNICNHYCKVPCAEVCPPCTMKCEYRCKHSRCQKRCSVPCTPCKEPCEWRCKHLKCTKFCSDICNREPCYESCDKFLKCGHPCVGFCGEPCPNLCRTCDNEELTTIYLGYEDEDDARFIFLTDCRHTIESQGLEQWMKQNDAQVSIKTCPKCKTPIRRTLRFMNELKKVNQDVIDIKKKLFGNETNASLLKIELVVKLSTLYNKGKHVGVTKILIKMLEEDLYSKHKTKNNLPSLVDLNLINTKANFLDTALNSMILYEKQAAGICGKELRQKFDHLISVLLSKDDKMTDQRISDFQLELKRFHRFAQLCMLKDSVEFRSTSNDDRKLLTDHVKYAENSIRSIAKYSDTIDNDVKSALELIRTRLDMTRKLTEAEMNVIIAATQMHKGHWYKCPNGHLYCVGECGQPMQISKCPECKESIGGENHALLPSNLPSDTIG